RLAERTVWNREPVNFREPLTPCQHGAKHRLGFEVAEPRRVGEDRRPVRFHYHRGHLEIVEPDRKSTRLNSSHVEISYAVFCLKDTASSEIYTLSLHDALPICRLAERTVWNREPVNFREPLTPCQHGAKHRLGFEVAEPRRVGEDRRPVRFHYHRGHLEIVE